MRDERAMGRRMAWVVGMILAIGFLIVMQVRVTTLKSEVQLADKRIVALKRDKLYLETEFETRANQQQLKAWNDVEFGYVAPRATQYLDSETQLAALGKPLGPDAPGEVRVAAIGPHDGGSVLPTMVSPITGKPLGAEPPAEAARPAAPADDENAAANLGARLIKVDHKVEKTARDGKLADAARSL